MSTWFAIDRALQEARQVLSDADMQAEGCARLVCGRLRHVDRYTLVRLKRELRDFDAGKREWKERLT